MLGFIPIDLGRFIPRRSRKSGLPPGTPVHIGEKKTEKVSVTVIDYDEVQVQKKEIEDAAACLPFRDLPTVTWINVDGVHDAEKVRTLGDCFGMHHLVLEDIMNTDQRPKVEDYDSYLYVVLKMLDWDQETQGVVGEQVSIVLGRNFVLSFHEDRDGDVFGPIRDRILNSKGRIRKMGADYLAYALVDAIVDHYFVILERLGEGIEDIEGEVFANPTTETLHTIQHMKREMIFLRKSIWPLREVVSRLERRDSELIQQETGIYLRDVYDHTIQVIEVIETFRDMLSGMLDIYLSSLSNRMNEVMKVLTIFAVIFIPLTFMAGIYGMNFEYMPELKTRWGYPLFWVAILVVGISMLVYFRRKRWL